MDPRKNGKPVRKESSIPERRGTEFLLEPPAQRMAAAEIGPRAIPEPEQLILPPVLRMGNPNAILRTNAEKFISVDQNKFQLNNNMTPFFKSTMEKGFLPPIGDKYLAKPSPGQMKLKPLNPSMVHSGKPTPFIPFEAQRQIPLRFQYADEDDNRARVLQNGNSWITSAKSHKPQMTVQNRVCDEAPQIQMAHVVSPSKQRENNVVFPRDYSHTSFTDDEPLRPKTPNCGRRLCDGEIIQPKSKSYLNLVNPYAIETIEHKPEEKEEPTVDEVRPVGESVTSLPRPASASRKFWKISQLKSSGMAIREDKPKSSVSLVPSRAVVDNSALKVANLHDDIGYEELLSLFPKASSITYPVYDREGPANLKPIRFCYVLFDDVEDAHTAYVEMDGTEVNGMTLNLDFRQYNTTS